MDEQLTTGSLYDYQQYPHTPQNVNTLHEEEHLSFNSHVALFITKHVGTMWCAYAFATLGIGSLIGVMTGNMVLGLVCGAVSSYFIQLVLLPIIMVGQNIDGRHAEILAEQLYLTTQKIYYDEEQQRQHLCKQDAKLLQLEKQNQLILKSLEQSRSRIVKSGTKAARRESITQEIEAVIQGAGKTV